MKVPPPCAPRYRGVPVKFPCPVQAPLFEPTVFRQTSRTGDRRANLGTDLAGTDPWSQNPGTRRTPFTKPSGTRTPSQNPGTQTPFTKPWHTDPLHKTRHTDSFTKPRHKDPLHQTLAHGPPSQNPGTRTPFTKPRHTDPCHSPLIPGTGPHQKSPAEMPTDGRTTQTLLAQQCEDLLIFRNPGVGN